MRFSEQDVVLSDCVCEFPCLYNKRLTRQKDPRVRIGLIKNSSIVKPLEKKWSFPLKISLVNETKFAVSCGFGHISWRNPKSKTSLMTL